MRPATLPLTLALALFAAMLIFPPRAEAASVVAMSLEEMAGEAEMILIGRVAGQRADWSTDRTRIYTYVTLEVDRYLKGGSSRTVTLRVLGGQVGPYLARVPGSPQFGAGEEVLLFCAGSGARLPTVLGLSMGKFTLSRDASGEAILRRDISTLMLANHRTDSRKPGDPVTRYRLDEVETRIASFLR